MLRNLLIVAVATCAILVGGQVQAAPITIDFEDIAIGSGSSDTAGDRISTGYLFDSVPNHTHRGNNVFGTGNGSTYLIQDDFAGVGPMIFSPLAGGTFSLLSIDLAEANTVGPATSVDVTGNLFGGGTIMLNFVLDGLRDGDGGIADFETLVLGAGWTNLVSVELKGQGAPGDNYFAFDNIVVDNAQVPEPTSLALLGMGVTGLCGYRLRRKRNLRA